MNDYIWLDDKMFRFIERKCSDIKQRSAPSRSLNGTLNIDILSTTCKKEWSFNFEVDEKGLLRLRNLWSINCSFTMIDWNQSSYTTTCSSESFDENFIGEINGVCWFNVTLEFKEI